MKLHRKFTRKRRQEDEKLSQNTLIIPIYAVNVIKKS